MSPATPPLVLTLKITAIHTPSLLTRQASGFRLGVGVGKGGPIMIRGCNYYSKRSLLFLMFPLRGALCCNWESAASVHLVL